MIKHKEQRIGVFVDVANMYHTAKNLYGKNVNFSAILKDAVGQRKLVRAIAYVVRSKSGEEGTFFEALEKQGFELKVKDLQVFAGGAKKADWDVGLSVDAIKFADRLDSIILVSGDGDYVPLVHYLQENKGCMVEVIAFGKTTSSKLREEVNDFTDMGENPRKFLLPGGRKQTRKK